MPRAWSSKAVTGAWISSLDLSQCHCACFSDLWTLPKASFQKIDSSLAHKSCESQRHIDLVFDTCGDAHLERWPEHIHDDFTRQVTCQETWNDVHDSGHCVHLCVESRTVCKLEKRNDNNGCSSDAVQ